MSIKIFTLSLFFALLGAFSLSAQDAKPAREVGIQFSSLDFDGTAFSAFYKKQKKENVYRRIRFFSGRLQAGQIGESFELDFFAGLAIGREKRKSLDDKLVFYQGPEFAFNLGLQTLGEDRTLFSATPAFGWVLGLQHSFNERWAVNLETIPSVGITAQFDSEDESRDALLFGAAVNSTVSIGLVRKF